MKRSILNRRTELRRGTELARGAGLTRTTGLKRSSTLAHTSRLLTRQRVLVDEAGRLAFKTIGSGRCAGCQKLGIVRRHHLITENHVRRAGGNPWDQRNAIWIGIEGLTCDCHEHHHNASHRLPVTVVTAAAREFAVELLGADAAAAYFARYYAAGVQR